MKLKKRYVSISNFDTVLTETVQFRWRRNANDNDLYLDEINWRFPNTKFVGKTIREYCGENKEIFLATIWRKVIDKKIIG